jgi:hypothetical protein
MSLVGDHLRDDSCRGMYSATKDDVINEAMRLANQLAVARVRRYAFNQGLAQVETKAGIERRITNATHNLRAYLTKVL